MNDKGTSASAHLVAASSAMEERKARAQAEIEADARRMAALLTDGAGVTGDELDAVLNMYIAKYGTRPGLLATVLRRMLALAPVRA